MNQLPIIQTFFGKPVRFFEADFEIEMGGRNGPPSSNKIILKTWATPFPDYCRAVGYQEREITKIINRNPDLFDGFFRLEVLPDSLGRLQKTILMAQAMCDMITARLQASRIKDPATREMVIDFQRWVIFAFEAIRTGKLRPVRWHKGMDVRPEYMRILSLPCGAATMDAVKALAAVEKKSIQRIYRRLKDVRGTNAITARGIPRKSPSTSGSHKRPAEVDRILLFATANPAATNKKICALSDTAYHYGHVNAILRRWRREKVA
jgi:hypothetical protein